MASLAAPKRSPLAEALKGVRHSAADYGSIWSWIATVDHKRIGILYGVSAFVFFLIGGAEALLLRVQLAQPDSGFLDPDAYNLSLIHISEPTRPY